MFLKWKERIHIKNLRHLYEEMDGIKSILSTDYHYPEIRKKQISFAMRQNYI